MGRYDVFAFCKECGSLHPMGVSVMLDKGPVVQQSIGEMYKGEDLPENIRDLTNSHTYCPALKKFFLQMDNKQIFLVPVKKPA